MSPELGLGIGWRPELEPVIDSDPDLFIEVIAENVNSEHLPPGLARYVAQGRQVIPHGIRLSLGGAELPDPKRLEHLQRLAARVGAPLVSEHIAFARAHGVEAGHVLPVPRTQEALEIIAANVAAAQAALDVPLALEHVSALSEWPDPEFNEPEFIAALIRETGAALLLDVSNLYANGTNHGFDPVEALDVLPLERIAYVHVGGGVVRDGRYHDTHTDPVVGEVLNLLAELARRGPLSGVLLERDGGFPADAETQAELNAIRDAAGLG
ncbi:MAG: DUF692 domain-containing protein [Solirubrobacterales bacterium]|nr:DUF692 domain-containing protein [Solirubrobacterales bacterium]